MQFSIIASLAFIAIATALPSNEVVPEDNFYAVDDDLSEARETLSQMKAAGRSDKDCRKLVDETKKEITTNVNTNQKIIDGLPDGSQCMNLGQAYVKKTTDEKKKADKDEKTKCDEVTKAESASVDFGSRTFSSLTVGKCSSFYSSSAYTTAKTRYTSAVTACTKARGAAAEAAKALTSAKAAAEKAKNKCLCKTKKDHEKAFTDGNAANAANLLTWAFAHHLECVLDGKTACRVPPAPTVTRGKLTGAAKEAKCSAVPAAPTFVKTAGQNCAAAGFKDIMNLKECIKARNQLGFAQHKSAISDNTMTNRPHGCTVSTVSNQNGLIRLYHKGTQACNTQYQNFCLCTKR